MQYRRTSNCEFAADSALAPVDILPNLTIQRFIQLVTAHRSLLVLLRPYHVLSKIEVYLQCRRIGIFAAIIPSNRALL